MIKTVRNNQQFQMRFVLRDTFVSERACPARTAFRDGRNKRAVYIRGSSSKAPEGASKGEPSDVKPTESNGKPAGNSTRIVDPEVSKEINKLAATFAPRQSGPAKKNPAVPGSVLYTVFDVQAWLGLVVGGLLSFNVIFPTDDPSIPRLLGMWSVWMFTVPSLRARECRPEEKDALNLLFVALPVMNVALPFVWKSFPFVFSADVVALLGIMYWKVWSAGQQR
uniref:Resistance to phytophthora 1 protein n=1 Tax=Tetraselmis sp. GSL018 TaxID=582737 RepID=A0A061S3G0_9CHLO|mmetsp:Transcript_23061/g.55167  ORF Transcript_23061/g.55167 Transcript_23061/m.55167 type:complete len:223 (+) Transcript_23061:110-778(+)